MFFDKQIKQTVFIQHFIYNDGIVFYTLMSKTQM